MIQRFVLTLLCIAIPAALSAQSRGSISGRVMDSISGSFIVGAEVSINGGSVSTKTDTSGTYRLLDVPAGTVNLTVTSLGYNASVIDVTVEAENTLLLDIPMIPFHGEEVRVETPLLEGQASALNQQKTAINIKNVVVSDQFGRFPDANAAEAVQRIPGVTLERDQGEGRFVIIRGTEPRLTSSTINGERIPSPEGDVRFVALDVIPAYLLDAIEVTKALTPDMEADAIGGSVNFVTKRAPDKTRYSISGGAGYNNIVEDGQAIMNGTFGTRGMEGRAGLIASGSYMTTDRGSKNYESEYDEGRSFCAGASRLRDEPETIWLHLSF